MLMQIDFLYSNDNILRINQINEQNERDVASEVQRDGSNQK